MFLVRLAILSGLLLAPWPGCNERYNAWICRVGGAVFSSAHGRLLVRFEPEPPSVHPALGVRITLANRERLAPDGTGPARVLGLDARGVGWVPTAWLVALILATPLPWPRRLGALAWGLIAVHAFIALTLGVYLLNNCDDASGLALVHLSPLEKAVIDGLDETLVAQMGPGFVAAVLLWVLVSFRRGDWRLLRTVVAGSEADGISPLDRGGGQGAAGATAGTRPGRRDGSGRR